MVGLPMVGPVPALTAAATVACCVAQEKEDWINAVGRAIVRHSKRWVLDGVREEEGHRRATSGQSVGSLGA